MLGKKEYFSKNVNKLFQINCLFTLIICFYTNIYSQQLVKYETFEFKMSQGGWNVGFGSPQTYMNGSNNYFLQMGAAFAGFNSVIPQQSLNGNSATNSYYYSNGSTSPYNPTLNANTGGLVEWYVQMKSGQTGVQPGGLISGRQGMGLVLASSQNANSYTSGNRYALVYGDANGAINNGKLQLIAVADNSSYAQGTVICSTPLSLSSFTSGNPHDHYAIKVSYNPATNEWSLFVRNDGTSFKGPFHSNNFTQVGAATVDNQFTNVALNTMAYVSNSTSASDRFYFDSYYVFTGIQNQVGTPQISIMSTSLSMGANALIAGKSPCNLGDVSQFFLVSGSNLTGNLTITPPSGAMISLNDTSNYATNAISITPLNGYAQAKIYVKHNSSSSYLGSVSASSTGAVTKSISVAEVFLGNLTTTDVVLNCNDPSTPISVSYKLSGKTINGKWNTFSDLSAYTVTSGMANNTSTCGFQTGADGIRSYTAQEFQVSQTGTYTFTLRTSSSFNGAGYITTGSFTPGSCSSGTWISGSDDATGTVLGPILLNAGQNYTLFTTTGGAPSFQSCYKVSNTYTWDITTPGVGELMLPLITCDNKISGSVDAYYSNGGAVQIDNYSQRVTNMNNSATCAFSSATNHNYAIQDFQVSVSGNYTFTLQANSFYDGQGYIVKHDPQLSGVGFSYGNCIGGGTFIQGDDVNGEATISSVFLDMNKIYTLVTSLKGSEPANNASFSGGFVWNIAGAGNVLLPGVGQILWYTSSTGGIPIASGGGFNPVGLDPNIPNTSTSGTWTYYAAFASSSNCRTSANYTINNCLCVAPTISTITSATCSTATGSIALTGLPSSGAWIVTTNPGAATTSGSGATTTISALAPGTYTFTVTQSGCTSPASAPATILAPPALPSAPTISTITSTTCSTATGSIALTGLPSSGAWIVTTNPGAATTSGSGATTTISALAPGTYTFTVTQSGCTSPASAPETILAPPTLPSAPTISTITSATCSTATGSIALTGLPSSGAWTITTNPGAATTSGSGATTTISALAPGTYTFTVTQSGCASPVSAPATILAPPTLPSAPTISTITSATCSTATGSIALTGLPSSGTWVITAAPTGTTTNGSGTTTTISGFMPGTYSFTVTQSGCTSAASAQATILSPPTPPSPPTISTIIQATCSTATGSIALSGMPSSGTWIITTNPGGTTTNGSGTTTTFSPLVAGTYTFLVTQNGCTSVASAPATIDLPPTLPIINLELLANTSCFESNDGVLIISVTSGEAPFNYSWQPNISNNDTLSGLSVGTYSITINDNNGCSADSSFTINSPEPLTIVSDQTNIICGETLGSINTNITGGSGPYYYAWLPNGETSSNLSNLAQGNYTVSIEDNNGCNISQNYTITNDVLNEDTQEEIMKKLIIPNVITPNGDGINDFLDISEILISCIEFEIDILNRWGNIVYVLKEANSPFNGKSSNGDILTEGVYFYVIRSKHFDCNDKKFKGNCSGNITIER